MDTQSDNTGDDTVLDAAMISAPLVSKPVVQRKDSCSSYSASGSSSSESQSSDSDSEASHKSSSSQSYKSEQQQGRQDKKVEPSVSRRSVLGLRTRPPKRRVCIQSSGSEEEVSDKQSNDGSDYVASQSEKSEELDEESASASGSAESIWSDEYLPKKRTITRRTKKKPAKVWDSDPDTYGVWRSSRTRKLPSRYAADNDSDSEYDGPGKGYRRNNFIADSSEEETDNGRKRKSQWKKFGAPIRATSRKKEQISYKEQSSGEGNSGVEYEFLPGEDYYYEEEQDNRPTVEKVLQQRIGKIGDIGPKTAYWRKNQDGGGKDDEKDDKEEDAEERGTEVQYLIKWLGYSHLHNTWETEDSLGELNVKGIKKLHNFMRREEEKEAWLATASKEDIEYFECQDEMAVDLLEQHKQVERVIASRRSDDGSGTSRQEYLCKWKGLPYSECTWDDSELVSQDFQEQIDNFIRRHNSDCIPTKSCKVIKNRPKFRYMKEQPSYIGRDNNLVLRDYQLDGLNWLVCSWCKEDSVILADEMGLGKTIQGISFLSHLYHTQALYGPFLLVVPLSTMASWQKEFTMWSPEINAVVYLGDINSRNIIKEYELIHEENKRLKFNALLTTYEILLKDANFLSAIHWAVLLVDEAHRLKNDDSQLYTSLKTFTTNHRVLITGTPLQNSLKELWALLHFIMQKEFSNCTEFESEYGGGDAASLAKLHQRLEPYLLRRVKKDVEKSLPAKVEQILRVEMSSIQKKYYKWILTKNYKALTKGLKGSTTSFVNIVMELKKCCNHGSLIRPIESSDTMGYLQTLIHGSGKLFLLDKLLCRLKEGGHRVLIFSQMVMMLDILAEYLQLRHFNFQRLDGSIRGELRKQALDHFNAEGSQDFCFLLSTRAGGLGVNLATADTVIIFDSDWNPQNDLQAQARAHRIGQKKQVNIYRLITSNSIEEDIIERAKKKMVLDHLVIQRMDTTGRTVLSNTSEPSKFVPFSKEELNAVLKFGAEDLFKETVGDDKALQEMDLDEILKRAETQESDPSISNAANELLSQFNVTSFAIDDDMMAPVRESVSTPTKVAPDVPVPVEQSWDEIIPEDVRARIKEEEELEEQLQLYLPPRQRRVQNYAEDKFHEIEKQDGKKSYRRKAGLSNTTTASGRTALGFTDAEIRRFIKSYKKFGDPCSRLQDIAADASLHCKQSQLKKLAQTLHTSCVEAEQKSLKITQSTANGKKQPAVTLKLGGVTVNCQSILRREEELAPLARCIPKDPATRKRYRMVIRPKAVRWGVSWSAVEDSKLLVGLYEHGMGNWADIKQDKALGLQSKILPRDQNHKPQAKDLQTRVEYLLKLLQTEAKQAQEQTTKSRTPKKKPASKKQTTMDEYSGYRRKRKNDNSLVVHISLKKIKLSSPIKENAKIKAPKLLATGRSSTEAAQSIDNDSKHSASSEKRFKTKAEMKAFPVIHGSPTATAAHSCEDEDEIYPLTKPSADSASDAELDSDTFLKCKEILRPEKKSLSQLQNPSEGLSKEEKLTQYKKCLVKIGDCISQHVKQFTDDEDALQEWNSNLWIFVSKFTSASAGKLYKIYRKAKKNLSSGLLSDSEHQKPVSNSSAPVTNSSATEQEKKEVSSVKNHDEDAKQHTSSRSRHHSHHRDRSHSHERSTSRDRSGSSSRHRHRSSSTGHRHHHHHRHHDHHRRHSSSSRDDRHHSSSSRHHSYRHHSPTDRYHHHHHYGSSGSSHHHHHHHHHKEQHDFSPGRRRES